MLFGAFTDIAGLMFALDMLGAITFVHAKNGFSVAKGGIEWPLLLVAAALAIALAGPGQVRRRRPTDSLIPSSPPHRRCGPPVLARGRTGD